MTDARDFDLKFELRVEPRSNDDLCAWLEVTECSGLIIAYQAILVEETNHEREIWCIHTAFHNLFTWLQFLESKPHQS